MSLPSKANSSEKRSWLGLSGFLARLLPGSAGHNQFSRESEPQQRWLSRCVCVDSCATRHVEGTGEGVGS